MKHEDLLKTIEEYYENTDENIIGVEYGYKEVDGKLTKEKSIVFTVKEKKPIESLSENEILPKTINIENEVLTTDVVVGSYDLVCDSTFYSWQTTPPTNRNKFRPLKGGVSVTNYSSLSGYVGTLGLLAVDNDTGSLVGVSNNHVLIDDAFICSERDLNGSITNIKNDQVTQPNEPSNYGIINSIGIVKKYYPIKTGTYNYVYVALTTINESDISYTESFKQEGLLYDSTLPFATTTEINNIMSTDTFLYSSGRTTGAKGEGNTKLKVFGSPAVISTIYYNKQGVLSPISFSDCIKFVASGETTPDGTICIYPIAGGDSGSALIADIGGVKKIVGIVFASGSNGLGQVIYGFACRIDRIETLMNISSWNGEVVEFSNTIGVEEYTLDGLSNEISITDSGKTFWQVGLRNKT